MATWFNLAWLAETPDPGDRTESEALTLFSATIYTAEGKRVSSRYRSVSRALVLARLGQLGMFRSSEPRLFVRIEDPMFGDTWIPLTGPQEADEAWVTPALERVKERISGARG
jgi:hypothetical protein